MTKEKKTNEKANKLYETRKNKTIKGKKYQIKRVLYEDFTDHECVTIYTNKDWCLSLPVWKEGCKLFRYKTFDSESTTQLFEILSGLIERLTDDVAPNEEVAIRKLGNWIIEVISQRLKVSEETKTRRNKLIRYLREEINKLKK